MGSIPSLDLAFWSVFWLRRQSSYLSCLGKAKGNLRVKRQCDEAAQYRLCLGRSEPAYLRVRPVIASNTHLDHLGSPVAATNPSGGVLWRESYNPYGEKRTDPAGNQNKPGFTGHVDDDSTGLTYMQARYYSPVLGRFLSNDPVGFTPARPDMFNRYAYAGNDPVNYWHPDGRQCMGSGRL